MTELIKYQHPSDEQIANLRAFTLRGERSDPITFVGRDDILKRIPALIQNKRQDPFLKSIAQVIQGAPGAGKTSLLNELERTNGGDLVTVVRLDGEDLSEPLRVAGEFMASVSADVSDIGAVKSRTHQTTADIPFAKHQEGWETSKTSALDHIAKGASVWRTLEPLLKVGEDHVFLLLVDEAQRVATSPGKNINEAVTSLHTGGTSTAGLRILTVYAGLGDTIDQLFDVGLSRESIDPHRIGVLSLEEAQVSTLGFLTNSEMGLDEALTHSTRMALSRVMAVASEGWPRHLHRYETGLAQKLVDDLDSPRPMRHVSLESVLEYGHSARVNFYATRLRLSRIREVGNALKALSKSMGSSISALNRDDIMKYVVEHYSNMAEEAVADQINRAVHAGILEPVIDEGYYNYPVPSFSTFMACGADREATKEKMRSDIQTRLGDMSGDPGSGQQSGFARD